MENINKLRALHGGLLPLLCIMVISLACIACGRQTKEATQTPGTQQVASEKMKKSEKKDLEAQMKSDAIALARATCLARQARTDIDEHPDDPFYVKKAENLKNHKNQLAAEMKVKYENDPATKEKFNQELELARMELEECKGMNQKKPEGQ